MVRKKINFFVDGALRPLRKRCLQFFATRQRIIGGAEENMTLSRRHILRKGDQWLSLGWRFENDDGWIDIDSQYWGKTIASVDPNNLHSFRRKDAPQKAVEGGEKQQATSQS